MTKKYLLLVGSLAASAATAAQAQQNHLFISPVIVSYSTGDEANCPNGFGVGLDGEARFGGRLNVGASAGLRAANALVCTDIGSLREVEGHTVQEFSYLSLGRAPVGTLSLGAELSLFGFRILPRVRAGWIRGTVDAVEDQHEWMPLRQLEVIADRGGPRFLFRVGEIRAFVVCEGIESGQREIVGRESATRRLIELGIQFPR